MREIFSGSVDYLDALRSAERSETYREWVRQRTETLKQAVSAHDVLRYFGVQLKYSGDDNEEQISCPFHGQDADPSARVFPSDARSSSRLYCFVCQARWDIFALWKKFQGQDELRFTAILLGLEKAFGLPTPEAPKVDWEGKKSGPTEEEHALFDLLAVTERRLRQAKPSFEMKGFFVVCKLLDRIHHEVQQRQIEVGVADQRVRAILDKVGEKIRSA